MNRGLLISILICFVTIINAQKTQKVTASYTYYAPENVTLEEAKRTALDRAKLSAIEEAFGTLVTQSNSTVICSENGNTESQFLSLGGSEVKGEWIETTKEPEYNIKYEGDMLVVSVEVSGRIREIINAGVDFIAKILRNGRDERYESHDFRSGDDMFLYFKSPVDGYLAVYLLDETTQEVFCLLPYKASGDGAYTIEHDKPYVFFSSKNVTTNPELVDEYTMTCSREVEINDIYVIFSQNSFSKANSVDSKGDLLPRYLRYKDFQKWLTNVKRKDTKLRTMDIGIRITNPSS